MGVKLWEVQIDLQDFLGCSWSDSWGDRSDYLLIDKTTEHKRRKLNAYGHCHIRWDLIFFTYLMTISTRKTAGILSMKSMITIKSIIPGKSDSKMSKVEE